MRKIEKEMIAAVRGCYNWKKSNTEVRVFQYEDGTKDVSVLLHGNLIFHNNPTKGVFFSFAGWDTATTRSRLRALGCGFESKNGRRLWNGIELPTDCTLFQLI